jgi:hypothetical protein
LRWRLGAALDFRGAPEQPHSPAVDAITSRGSLEVLEFR